MRPHPPITAVTGADGAPVTGPDGSALDTGDHGTFTEGDLALVC